MQIPDINAQILNNGVDEDVIDGQIIKPDRKKKKMVRLLAVLGFGLIAGGGYMMYADKKPSQPVSPELQRILSQAEKNPPKQSIPAAAQTQSVPTPPQSTEQQANGSKPLEEQKPVSTAAPQPTPEPATAPSTTAQTKLPAADVKAPAQPAQSDKEILLGKKVERLIATVEALKTQVAKLSQQQRTPAPAAAGQRKQMVQQTVDREATDLPVKIINLKENGIVATTVNSLIVYYGGKNQEIFIGDVIPGIAERLVSTNLPAREFVTNRAVYRSAN